MSVTTQNLSFQPETYAPTHSFSVAGAGTGDKVFIHIYKDSSFQEPFRRFSETELDVSGGYISFDPDSNEVLSWPSLCWYRLYFNNGGTGNYELLYQGSVTVLGGAILPPLQSSAIQLMKVRQILTDDGQFPFTFPIGTVILGVVAKTVVTLSGTITLENPDANNVLTEETLPDNRVLFYEPDAVGTYFTTSGKVAVDCSAWPASGGVDITIIYTVL